MSYTIQHIKTGKYISSLFSDSIRETFQADNIDDAYQWSGLYTCQRVAAEINMKDGHVIKGLEITERNIIVQIVEI